VTAVKGQSAPPLCLSDDYPSGVGSNASTSGNNPRALGGNISPIERNVRRAGSNECVMRDDELRSGT